MLDDPLLVMMEQKGLHAHEITDDIRLHIPPALLQWSTHYLTHGPDVVFYGKLPELKRFVTQFVEGE